MKRKFIGRALCTAIATVLLCGCGSEKQLLLSYDDQIHPEEDRAYIEEMFYRNDLETIVPDPCVIQITDPDSTEYGYFYLYGTDNSSTGFRAFRNKDLTGDWQDMTMVKNIHAYYAEKGTLGYNSYTFWAPEVIYDEETDKYYMFYTTSVEGTYRSIAVAIADEPYGPFLPAETDGLDAHTPLLPEEKLLEASGLTGNYFNTIDAHPFVAPDGTKYLYFVCEGAQGLGGSAVAALEMETWTKPNFSTFTQITKPYYYTVDELWTDENGSTDPGYYDDVNIDEGPYMYAHQMEDGSYKYYMCFSANGYGMKTYQVAQAVSDSPTGPFRKLTEEEGGILLSADHGLFDHASGTGHHSFVKVDGQLYIVYHAHLNRESGGSTSPRGVAVDRVNVVKNNNGDEVLYCNGPTWSLQPRLEQASGYRNLASEATVTVTNGENVEALTDGLLSIYRDNTFVKEFETDETATITFTFDETQEVSALMVYNSKLFTNSFVSVKRVEFDYVSSGEVGTTCIEDLAFDWDFYKMESASEMRPGGSAVAVFNPLRCKEIRITIELPEAEDRPDEIAIMDELGYYQDQSKVAVSEIVILGK